MFEGQNLPNDELETNDTHDETTTEDQEATTEAELETEQNDEPVTLSRAELEEREREIRKEQDRRWKERIKNLDGKESRDESGKESRSESVSEGVASKEELDRFRLETKGIEDKAQQDFVLKFARLEGVSVTEALRDEYVKTKMERMMADTERGRATQSPTNRTGKPREKSPEELAREAESKGKIPKTPAERKAALKVLQAKYGRT